MYVMSKGEIENRKKSSDHGQGLKISSSPNRRSVVTSFVRVKAVASRQGGRSTTCRLDFSFFFFFLCVPLYSPFFYYDRYLGGLFLQNMFVYV